ncbi:MAG: DUF2786 domain-containing protein [Ilumatobacteraceae bacterium]
MATPPHNPTTEVHRLVSQGVIACLSSDPASFATLMDVVRALDLVDRDDLVDTALVVAAAPHLGGLWERGWSPLDVVHLVQHRFHRTLAAVMADIVLADGRLESPDRPAQWDDELAELRAGRRRKAPSRDEFGKLLDRFEMVRLVVGLPHVVAVVDPPSAWGSAPARTVPRHAITVEPRMLDRIRALLAKAESTTFDAEADAFMTKAQELMARYAIDAAMVQASASPQGLAAGVRARRVHIDDPYAPQKAQLLGVVAATNGAKVVWHDDFGAATVIGFDVELDLTELTFTSLLVQMTRSMAAAGGPGSRTRSPAFRRAFVLSFAVRIGERLDEAVHAARDEAGQTYGSALVPVQQAREAAVRERAAEWFPRTTPMRSRSVDAGGWHAGRLAADLAQIDRARAAVD